MTWTKKNLLALKGSKTQAIILGPNGKLMRLDVKNPLLILDKPVKFVKQYNYLGIMLDSKMTPQPMLKHEKRSRTNKMHCTK